MPEIRIHRTSNVWGWDYSRKSEWQSFIEWLRQECARCFSTNGALAAEDFSVYDELVTGLSVQSYSVIIRVTLHHYSARVRGGETWAKSLADKVATYLNTEPMVKQRGRVSVGVSLVLAEIAWGTA